MNTLRLQRRTTPSLHLTKAPSLIYCGEIERRVNDRNEDIGIAPSPSYPSSVRSMVLLKEMIGTAYVSGPRDRGH